VGEHHAEVDVPRFYRATYTCLSIFLWTLIRYRATFGKPVSPPPASPTLHPTEITAIVLLKYMKRHEGIGNNRLEVIYVVSGNVGFEGESTLYSVRSALCSNKFQRMPISVIINTTWMAVLWSSIKGNAASKKIEQ
jgi:hypothetical protein